jgi:hypothetical protein
MGLKEDNWLCFPSEALEQLVTGLLQAAPQLATLLFGPDGTDDADAPIEVAHVDAFKNKSPFFLVGLFLVALADLGLDASKLSAPSTMDVPGILAVLANAPPDTSAVALVSQAVIDAYFITDLRQFPFLVSWLSPLGDNRPHVLSVLDDSLRTLLNPSRLASFNLSISSFPDLQEQERSAMLDDLAADQEEPLRAPVCPDLRGLFLNRAFMSYFKITGNPKSVEVAKELATLIPPLALPFARGEAGLNLIAALERLRYHLLPFRVSSHFTIPTFFAFPLAFPFPCFFPPCTPQLPPA